MYVIIFGPRGGAKYEKKEKIPKKSCILSFNSVVVFTISLIGLALRPGLQFIRLRIIR